MKVLVVGGGGREHALCWAIAASPLCDQLYCAPGNAGIAREAQCVDVGPEAPLVLGLADALTDAGIKTFGPSAAAAQIEGSKGYMKDLLAESGVPTAAYGRFTDINAAKAYIAEQGAPIVVKTDGLAAGKGVILCDTVEDAYAAVDSMMSDKTFGDAGDEIVIEEFLDGEEISFFALVDGTNALPLISAQDHKAVGDGDTGPNTGGMGAYSPAPVMTEALETEIMDSIVMPTVKTMAAKGTPYVGVLFAGLMITPKGPKILEYNVRFGDPECQVLMRRLKSDLLPALVASVDGQLDHFDLRWHDETAMVVVMAANGYPGSYKKGTEIKGIDAAEVMDGVVVFHAGTKSEDGKLLATGGRVLGVTASGASVTEAQKNTYAAVDAIDWPDGFCRRDIGWRAVARESGG
jgi:phosphoribosylamine--glycine ligase